MISLRYNGPEERAMFAIALNTAPTVLEALFWGWLCGHPGAERLLFEELLIVDFDEDAPGGEFADEVPAA